MRPRLVAASAAAVLLGLGGPAAASQGAGALGRELSLLWVLPFALMLLAIAVVPLWKERFWHPNRNKALVCAALGLPVLVYVGSQDPGALLHTGREYVSFILLLAALFVISGGINVRADLRATPLVNTAFLALGALLASLMGTTGAAVLLIRPLLETNHQRTKVVHTVIFFIFVVANIGGSLTPLGDPPLFMGYLAGVPFAWTLRLGPAWALAVGLLLAVYFTLDTVLYRREPAEALARDAAEQVAMRVQGAWLNGPLLLCVVLSVALLTERVVPFPAREGVLVALALVSWFATRREVRAANKFTFYPIVEVAVLFAGIFATMIPPILILQARGAELGVTSPAAFFWSTGALSSFLDNTPTYVVFFALAKSVGVSAGAVSVAGVEQTLLVAISLGAVFMGANTYIGNAPNFMVKSIAESGGIKMPSFFGYMAWSLGILVPCFV
ncbi:MAG TPA: sodium:proton antiporter, partial [Myxococcota bacterium]|nr:sodium:proton antiporter [Myxococcota bacterium]